MKRYRDLFGSFMVPICMAAASCAVDDPGITSTAGPPGRGRPGPGTGGGGAGGPGTDPAAPFMPVVFSDVTLSGSGGAGSGTGPGVDEKNCGFSKFDLERRPAEILVVLDKSGSMSQSAPPHGQKWTSVTSALDTVVMRTQDLVYWGLKLYPSDSNCTVADGVNVDVALRNHARLMAAVGMTGPNGNTPTRLAMEKATAYLKPRMSPNPRYILLATDGQPNCLGSNRGGDDPAGAVAAVAAAAAAGFRTFVVGVATTGSSAHGTLNLMADAGREPRKDPATRYYPVSSRDEFVAALEAITGRVATCQFALDKAPPSPSDVAVDVAGGRAPRDTNRMDGWDYADDMKAINLYGAWCERLKAASSADVKITFGCPNVAIP